MKYEIRYTAYNIRHTKSGFTLLEILLVIGIFAVLAAAGVSPLLLFKKTSDLNGTLETGASFLLEARAKTLSSENESRYGVHFRHEATVLFKGAAFTEGALGNEVAPLPSSVEISNVSLQGGGNDVVWNRLTGEADAYGAVAFRLKSDTSKVRTLRIEKTGIISTE